MSAPVASTDRVRSKHISVRESGNEVNVHGRLKSGTGVVFALLGGAVVAGLLFVTVSPRSEANPRNAVLVLTSAGLLLGAGAAILMMRRERLAFGDGEILHEKTLAGFCWSRRKIERNSVDTVSVQTRGAGGHGLAIIGRQGRLLIGGSLQESDLEWLRAWVNARLA